MPGDPQDLRDLCDADEILGHERSVGPVLTIDKQHDKLSIDKKMARAELLARPGRAESCIGDLDMKDRSGQPRQPSGGNGWLAAPGRRAYLASSSLDVPFIRPRDSARTGRCPAPKPGWPTWTKAWYGRRSSQPPDAAWSGIAAGKWRRYFGGKAQVGQRPPERRPDHRYRRGATCLRVYEC